jgi:hypothetical protein
MWSTALSVFPCATIEGGDGRRGLGMKTTAPQEGKNPAGEDATAVCWFPSNAAREGTRNGAQVLVRSADQNPGL